ncbi:MAG: cache domain-containing protein [Deltaproteobacteria bacterium]|nr:cache domain-containing protein [Deltaproteobacteria bacterium]
MIRFRDLRVRTKLAVTFTAVLLPLLVAQFVAAWSFRRDLRESAEVELTNLADHLWRLCDAQRQRSLAAGHGGTSPRPEDMAYLREVLVSFQVGRTGYAYAMDTRGVLLVHPTQEGRDILDSRDSDGRAFIREIVERAPRLPPGRAGTIRYPWQNVALGDPEPRMKILKYRWFAPWGWILAVGSYEEEIYRAVGDFELRVLPIAGASLVLVVVLTILLARLITRPLRQLAAAAAGMADGDLTHRVLPQSGDEFGALARAFNVMADEIAFNTRNLGKLVDERTAELRESRETYRSLVESTVSGIVTTDDQGKITFVNQALERLLGFRRDELLGREIWRFYVEGKDQARKIMRLLRAAGNVANLEMSLVGRERHIPIRTSASILRDGEGRERGTLGIFSDITAEKKLEADLERTQAHLVQTMKLRALGDLVAGVAHEINNPLMASTALLHVMNRDVRADDAVAQRRLDVLHKCNDRIGRIVNHLREFSRQSELEPRPISVLQPLENALLITGQQLLNHQIEIRRDFGEDLPGILGDPSYLEQVFLDIIANARDAMEGREGDKVLTIRAFRATLGDRPAAAVSIGDTGPGIPEAIREQIFEPFFTTKGVGKGTGLGLAIAYGIVEQHKGRIEFDSVPGQGATFRILIPAHEPQAAGRGREDGS